MPDSHRDIDLATILGNEFRDVFVPIVGNDCSRHDFYSAIADTFRQPVSADLLRDILASDLARLREGFEKYFECRGIEEQQLRTAIERTLWNFEN
jgi:hypothetical protein